MGRVKIISRENPERLPELELPLYVRSAGAHESVQTWWEDYPASRKPFVQVFWTERGAGEITLSDRKVVVQAGDFFYHLPGEAHRHRTIGVVWNYRWFAMDGPLAVPFIRGYGYPQEAIPAGVCPVQLFLELEMLLTQGTPYAQRHSLSVAAEILAVVGGRGEGRSLDPVAFFLRQAQERLSEPHFTAELFAREIGLHRTTFTRLFRQKTSGLTPRQYLIQIRLEKATRLLAEGQLSLKEIAQECGLCNASYLCRIIQQHTGMTPQRFRASKRVP